VNTSAVGALTELAVATALMNAGLAVFVPFFSGHGRVDLVYQTGGGKVRRVQCKSAHLVDNTVAFYTCSNTGGVRRTYVEDVDDFGVYCADTKCVYLVPCPTSRHVMHG
jgi:hypothetical protein